MIFCKKEPVYKVEVDSRESDSIITINVYKDGTKVNNYTSLKDYGIAYNGTYHAVTDNGGTVYVNTDMNCFFRVIGDDVIFIPIKRGIKIVKDNERGEYKKLCFFDEPLIEQPLNATYRVTSQHCDFDNVKEYLGIKYNTDFIDIYIYKND